MGVHIFMTARNMSLLTSGLFALVLLFPGHTMAGNTFTEEATPPETQNDTGHNEPSKSLSTSLYSISATLQPGGTGDSYSDNTILRTYHQPIEVKYDLKAKDHGFSLPATTYFGDKIMIYNDGVLKWSGGHIDPDSAHAVVTMHTDTLEPGYFELQFRFRYDSGLYPGQKRYVWSPAYPIRIIPPADHAEISMYTTTPKIAQGSWAKVAGFLRDEYGEGISGKVVHIRKLKGDGSVNWMASVTTGSNGYFQKWFQPSQSAYYTAGFDGEPGNIESHTPYGSTSDVRVQVTPVGLYAIPSMVTYGWWPSAQGSWTKLAGHLKDDNGKPIAGAKVYIQRHESGEHWEWVATKRTSSTGYYQHWVQPVRTFDYIAMAEKDLPRGLYSRQWSPKKRVHVKLRSDMTVSPSDIGFGRWVKLQGTVRPWHTFGTVYLQWYDYGQNKWRYLGTTSITRNSDFTYWYRPAWKGYGKTPWQFRAKVVGDWDHLTNYTPVRTVNVR